MIKGAVAAVLTVLALLLPLPVHAQEEVDLELVLAVDVSLSMDYEEQKLQREGYAAAFLDEEVIAAIRSGGYGRIAVSYMEWAGVGTERLVVDWVVVDGAETAKAFSDMLLAAPIGRYRRTSISNGLMAAGALFQSNPYPGLRKVIDVSGDGPNNQGARVDIVRDSLVKTGITINGLPLVLNRGGFGFFDIDDLDEYYHNCVIGGFGAFTLPVREIGKFGAAIRQKLVLEIAVAKPRIIPAQATSAATPYDCLIGEKLWEEWRGRGFEFR